VHREVVLAHYLKLSCDPEWNDLFVDSIEGNDANSGLSRAAPWKTLQEVNDLQFQAGGRILFKAGSWRQVQLATKNSGSEDVPIIIHRYGEGVMPRIDGMGTGEDAVRLYNREKIELRNLEIASHWRHHRLSTSVYSSPQNALSGLVGTVTDSSGAAIRGVRATVTNTDAGISKEPESHQEWLRNRPDGATTTAPIVMGKTKSIWGLAC
jgi:hypothetical protein